MTVNEPSPLSPLRAALAKLVASGPSKDNSSFAGDPSRWPLYSLNDVRAALATPAASEAPPAKQFEGNTFISTGQTFNAEAGDAPLPEPSIELGKPRLRRAWAPAEAGSAPLADPQIQARYRGLDGKWSGWLPVLDGTTVEYRTQPSAGSAPLVLPEPVAWLISGGRTWKAAVVLSAQEADNRIKARADGSIKQPLFATPLSPKQESHCWLHGRFSDSGCLVCISAARRCRSGKMK